MTALLPVVLFFLAHAGLAFVVGFAEISFAARELLAARGKLGHTMVSLLQCAGCFGFWAGAVCAAFGWVPDVGVTFSGIWSRALVWAFAVAASNLLFVSVAGLQHFAPPPDEDA